MQKSFIFNRTQKVFIYIQKNNQTLLLSSSNPPSHVIPPSYRYSKTESEKDSIITNVTLVAAC